jgi:vacuolar-type H+-ATPase subunit H
MGFTENIVFYTIIIHLSLILITLSILYRYAQNIITRAKDDADKIKSQALGKAAEIESDLLNQSEKLKQERIILEEEYQRKNLAKSLELEAVRKKMIRLKKNQYDPRRQKKST